MCLEALASRCCSSCGRDCGTHLAARSTQHAEQGVGWATSVAGCSWPQTDGSLTVWREATVTGAENGSRRRRRRQRPVQKRGEGGGRKNGRSKKVKNGEI